MVNNIDYDDNGDKGEQPQIHETEALTEIYKQSKRKLSFRENACTFVSETYMGMGGVWTGFTPSQSTKIGHPHTNRKSGWGEDLTLLK